MEQNDFYPFGGRHANSALSQQSSPFANRWRFSGKEDLSAALGDPVLDFGARMYSSAGAMWQTQDPLAEKYYGVSQYVYCGNTPLLYIDPKGESRKLSVNNSKRIIKISAVYLYSSKESLAFQRALKSSIKEINSINMDYSTSDGILYSVTFDLSYKSVNNYKFSSIELDDQSNMIWTMPNPIPSSNGEIIGGTEKAGGKRNRIRIANTMRDDEITIMHEIMHSLGAEHKDDGLMQTKREKTQTKNIYPETIKEIIEEGYGTDIEDIL